MDRQTSLKHRNYRIKKENKICGGFLHDYKRRGGNFELRNALHLESFLPFEINEASWQLLNLWF